MKLIFSVLFIALVVAAGLSTYRYDRKCTRCLRTYQVEEKRFYGNVYAKTETLVDGGFDFVPLTGTPCQHIFRKDEFTSDYWGMLDKGTTGEGVIFANRWAVLKKAFALYQQTPNKDLLNQTFALADTYLPPDADMDAPNSTTLRNRDFMVLLLNNLQAAQSEKDWRLALEKTLNDVDAIRSR